jgi:hypothetical protein
VVQIFFDESTKIKEIITIALIFICSCKLSSVMEIVHVPFVILPLGFRVIFEKPTFSPVVTLSRKSCLIVSYSVIPADILF